MVLVLSILGPCSFNVTPNYVIVIPCHSDELLCLVCKFLCWTKALEASDNQIYIKSFINTREFDYLATLQSFQVT